MKQLNVKYKIQFIFCHQQTIKKIPLRNGHHPAYGQVTAQKTVKITNVGWHWVCPSLQMKLSTQTKILMFQQKVK
jgi:hypothetical protein